MSRRTSRGFGRVAVVAYFAAFAIASGWWDKPYNQGSGLMPPIGPIKRKDLVHFLRQVGFDGPFSGGKHQFTQRGTTIVHIPNPHQADIGTSLLVRILKQASVSRETWEKL
jgi:hypothetical protein